MEEKELKYDNGLGGFSSDGKEYKIKIKNAERTPLPWSQIMANEKFGTIVTSNGGGYTWYGNSRENKITSWSNDQISDRSSEKIYVKINDEMYSAMPEMLKTDYVITYGYGYAKYETTYKNIDQELITFIPKERPEKINLIKIKNKNEYKIKIKMYYCIEPVLGVFAEKTKKHLRFKKENNSIVVSNKYRESYFEDDVYIISSEKIIAYTCEKEEFDLISGIKREIAGIVKNPFVVIETEIELLPNDEKTIYFSLGQVSRNNFQDANEELEKTKKYWNEMIDCVQIKTPVESMNIIMNGWFTYQTLVSRIYARTSFYQCGGAFGFRDQLQDVLGVLLLKPEIAKKQILYHAKHQFKEGDVLHWWHPEKNNGIRSRYKDDLLWLPYIVCEYIRTTGDRSILDEQVPYIEGRPLLENEDEAYEETKESELTENLYHHCIKAVDISLEYGNNGLPRMWGGDWNDGMNKVRGESVWLGFFLYKILKDFSKVCEARNDFATSKKYTNELTKIRKALNENAWDGRWYRRAFFEDGTPLGSSQNEECKIDSICQSWSIISGAGYFKYIKDAMDSLDNYLVDRENMLIKLLTPAFNTSNQDPGYIRSYIPGVRENGGQYTHAAVWAIIANCLLGNGDRAAEYFRILNPIEHARTKEGCIKYKVEPYVVSADVYANPHLIGRGGWTWYTGSSAWLYFAGLKYILGFEKNGDKITINPCIPEKWDRFEIIYKYKNSTYQIKVKNTNHKSKWTNALYFDNELMPFNEFKLLDDKKIHVVEVEM